MFHVELRQFPNVARSFNLSRDELDSRVLGPWAAEQAVELDERRFSPQKAKLTVYEGPRLRPEEMGLGRGWGNVTKGGVEVTARLLQETRARATTGAAAVGRLKAELIERAVDGISLDAVLELAARGHPGGRVSEQLALAEQAVWELLHGSSMRMLLDGDEVDPAQWQQLLLTRETWLGGAPAPLRLEANPER